MSQSQLGHCGSAWGLRERGNLLGEEIKNRGFAGRVTSPARHLPDRDLKRASKLCCRRNSERFSVQRRGLEREARPRPEPSGRRTYGRYFEKCRFHRYIADTLLRSHVHHYHHLPCPPVPLHYLPPPLLLLVPLLRPLPNVQSQSEGSATNIRSSKRSPIQSTPTSS